jgi:glycosyltransferase involved in cell wall biosynthesis
MSERIENDMADESAQVRPPALSSAAEKVLVLTPVKNASAYLDRYFECLARLDYPRELLSLGLLEGDSRDGTYEKLRALLPSLGQRYVRVTLWKKDYGLQTPAGLARWSPVFQIPRRQILARARNHLLFRALADEAWVLWLDVDVIEYPPDLLRTLIATGHEIVHPHCVQTYGGPTFDRNAWRDQGRVHMEDLRGGPDLVRLDTVGGSVLLVRADLHRDGLIFPPFLYGRAHSGVRRPGPWGEGNPGEIETEGFGLMAADMGYRCWGMPNLEVLHSK